MLKTKIKKPKALRGIKSSHRPKLIGKLQKRPLSEYPVKGSPINRIEMVSVDIRQSLVQRIMRALRAESYVEEVGEFDWNLFGVVIVAEYPDGTRELLDGGHRAYMAKQLGFEEIPALIVSVKTEKEVSTMFHRYNGTVSKSVNPEELFIAKYHGDEEVAKVIAEGLEHCNLRVTNGKISVVNETNKTIKVTKFAQMYKRDPATTIITARHINNAFPDDKSVNVILFMGIFELIRTFELRLKIPWAKVQNSFDDFMHRTSGMFAQSSLTFPELRKDNHYGISVAWGLYKMWFRYFTQQNKTPPVAKSKIKNIYEEAGKKK